MAFDHNYFDFAMVAVHSWLKHSRKPTSFTMLTTEDNACDIESKMRNEIEFSNGNSLNVFWIQDVVDSSFLDWHVSRHISLPAYFKMLIPEIVQTNEKVLYLDSDTCIVDCMDDIFDVAMENDEVIGGVADFPAWWKLEQRLIAKMEWIPEDIKNRLSERYETLEEWYRQEMSLVPSVDANYMNSGVCLYDVPRCKAFSLTEKCIRLVEEQTKKNEWIFFHDQDALNSVCRDGHIKWLPRKWNAMWHITVPYVFNILLKRKKIQEYGELYKEETKNPCLIHYTGYKPWIKPSANYQLGLYWWYECKEMSFFKKHLSKLSQGVQKSLLSRLEQFEGESGTTLERFM